MGPQARGLGRQAPGGCRGQSSGQVYAMHRNRHSNLT